MSTGIPRPALTEVAQRHVVTSAAPVHFGERYANQTACGSSSADRTIFTRNVTCIQCRHRRALNESIAALRFDGARMMAALTNHIAIKGNQWATQ